MANLRTSWPLTLLFAASGCIGGGGSAGKRDGKAPPYEGNKPHFIVHGVVGGQQVSTDLHGGSVVVNDTCRLEIRCPDQNDPASCGGGGFIHELEVDSDLGGFNKMDSGVQLEFKYWNPKESQAGQTLMVVPETTQRTRMNNRLLPTGQVVFDFEVKTAFMGMTIWSEKATSGQVIIEALTLNPDSTGVYVPAGAATFGMRGEVQFVNQVDWVEFAFYAVCDRMPDLDPL